MKSIKLFTAIIAVSLLSFTSCNSKKAANECDTYLKNYEDYMNQCIAIGKKMEKEPNNPEIITEYTKLMSKAAEFANSSPAACKDDKEFAAKFLQIQSKIVVGMSDEIKGTSESKLDNQALKNYDVILDDFEKAIAKSEGKVKNGKLSQSDYSEMMDFPSKIGNGELNKTDKELEKVLSTEQAKRLVKLEERYTKLTLLTVN